MRVNLENRIVQGVLYWIGFLTLLGFGDATGLMNTVAYSIFMAGGLLGGLVSSVLLGFKYFGDRNQDELYYEAHMVLNKLQALQPNLTQLVDLLDHGFKSLTTLGVESADAVKVGLMRDRAQRLDQEIRGLWKEEIRPKRRMPEKHYQTFNGVAQSLLARHDKLLILLEREAANLDLLEGVQRLALAHRAESSHEPEAVPAAN